MISAIFAYKNRQRDKNQHHNHKYVPSFVVILLLTLLFTGCAGTVQQSQAISGHIKVSGSTALLPLVTAASQAFEKQYPQAKIDVSGGGSLVGLQAVTAGKTNIGDSDIYADPAAFPDPNLTDHIVCVTPFVMIVNRDVTINSLTRQNIIDIFSTGKYNNWDELQGSNIPINPIVRPNSSGTRVTFRKYILNGLDEKGTKLQVDDTQKVVNLVATTPGAIGYVALSAVTSAVKYVAIDGQEPTLENIGAGRYNFWSYEHMYTLGDDDPLVHAFLDYMTATTMQATVQQLHYIPIDAMKLPTVGDASTTNPSNQATLASTLLPARQESEDRRNESY